MKTKKLPVKQIGLTPEMKSNIMRASLQKSINEFMLQRSLVADQPRLDSYIALSLARLVFDGVEAGRV
jgi:hypothetical protein